MFDYIPFGTAPVGKSRYLYTDQPSSWLTKQEESDEIYYICNKDGYRERDWKDINWNNFILFLGDSATFGLGVKQKQTISYYLEELSDITCVNLGIPGTNLEVLVQLSLLLVNIKPKYVILQYPHLNRIYDPIDKNFHGNLGTWTNDFPSIPQKSKDLYNVWIQDRSRLIIKQKFYCNILRYIWKDNNLIEWTWDNDISEILNLPTFDSVPKEANEYARDGIHGNAQKNKKVAREIMNVIR